MGFIPTSHSFAAMIWRLFGEPSSFWKSLGEMGSFPLLALLFCVSLPKSLESSEPVSLSFLMEISLLPLLISFVFGLLHPAPGLFSVGPNMDVLWYILFVPLGEELLFRGWFYALIEKLWPKFLTATNPLPAAVWMSSVSFSIWHLQNIYKDPLGLVMFQVVYTFFTGLWLSYLRWKTGKIGLSCLAHTAINFLSLLC